MIDSSLGWILLHKYTNYMHSLKIGRRVYNYPQGRCGLFEILDVSFNEKSCLSSFNNSVYLLYRGVLLNVVDSSGK